MAETPNESNAATIPATESNGSAGQPASRATKHDQDSPSSTSRVVASAFVAFVGLVVSIIQFFATGPIPTPIAIFLCAATGIVFVLVLRSAAFRRLAIPWFEKDWSKKIFALVLALVVWTSIAYNNFAVTAPVEFESLQPAIDRIRAIQGNSESDKTPPK